MSNNKQFLNNDKTKNILAYVFAFIGFLMIILVFTTFINFGFPFVIFAFLIISSAKTLLPNNKIISIIFIISLLLTLFSCINTFIIVSFWLFNSFSACN